MRITTLRTREHDETSTVAARVDDDGYTEITGFADVGELLADPHWTHAAETAGGATRSWGTPLAPLVTHPTKIVCVGLNYKTHIQEMGRDLPEYPTLFAKFPDTLTGPEDDIAAVADDPDLDWEGELTIVIGTAGRRISQEAAPDHIAGYTIANDISMRRWQFRTKEWLQGKIWDRSTPVGPIMVSRDRFDYAGAHLRTDVTGHRMQDHPIQDLLFGPEQLVEYVSTMTTLRPGDLILTGTPGGVGRAQEPQVFLRAGDTVTVSIDGIGTLNNNIVTDV